MTKAGRQVTAALAVASAMTVWGRASANEEPICCRTCSLLLRSTAPGFTVESTRWFDIADPCPDPQPDSVAGRLL